MKPHVLMVVTSHGEMGPGKQTGVWLSEFAEAYELFREEGFRITVASPRGGSVPIDPRSLTGETRDKWPAALEALRQTVPIDEVDGSDVDALFLPGGHGTMFDFPENAALQALLRSLAERGQVIGAVCHGPAGLAGVTLSDGRPLVAGRKVTGFTNEEERSTGLDSLMPFLLESRLRELGAEFVVAPKWADHVEVDGNLITGQNPQSTVSAARAVISALKGAARAQESSGQTA
ncbi:MAG: type 1 glutamine amidotransferase domain-containing protein [Firmicutes bacterium]|nr:type 1 glutamine amidotransferase domain-containing protein [Bacillota bacterium]